MKKLAFLFVLLVFSLIIFSSCGSSPDQTKDQIKIFLDGNGYNQPYKIIDVETESPATTSAYFRKEIKMNTDEKIYFDYIILAKKENKNFLLFIRSDGNFPKVVNEIVIDSVATLAKPSRGTH